MKFKQPLAIATLMVAILMTMISAGCKKGSTPKPEDPQKNIPVPDSAMFVGTGNSDTTTLYVLNAVNGSLVKTYKYRHTKQVNNYIPLVGNGFLYVIENTKINALNPNTGAVLWSDSVKNATAMHTILHGDTFYGISTVYYNSMTVYAMDATKQTDTYLWQYPLSSNYANTTTNITYYNGLVYINTTNELTVLDAKTGTVKWSLSAANSIASLKDGIVTSGNNLLDAATGTVIRTIPSALVASNTSTTAALVYANKDLFFTKISQYANFASTSKLYAYDAATNALKWSIDAGQSSTGIYSGKTIDQIPNNQPIVRTIIGHSNGKYGTAYEIIYSAVDVNTGAEKWNYSAGLQGQNFQIDNTMYSCGTYTLNLAAGQPAASNINAADITTGKVKWINNNLPFSIGGFIGACVSVKGKGFASDIQ